MVNIYGITHHKRTGARFDFFNTFNDLRSYTTEKEPAPPKAQAKGSARRSLMRDTFPRVMWAVKRVVR